MKSRANHQIQRHEQHINYLQQIRDLSNEDNNEIDIIQEQHRLTRKLNNNIFRVFISGSTLIFVLAIIVLFQNFSHIELTQLTDSIQFDQDSFQMREGYQTKYQIQGLSYIMQSHDPQLWELEFCLIVIEQTKSKYSIEQILQSIQALNYTNYTIININSINDDSDFHYFAYSRIINILSKSKCKKNSILIFINQPLLPSALAYLNEKFQTFNIWAMYVDNKDENAYQLIGFYRRIYELLELNDFDNSNHKYLSISKSSFQFSQQQAKQIVAGVQMIGIMQMCIKHFKFVQRNKIYKQNKQLSYFNFNRAQPLYLKNRTKYQKLTKLSQDYITDVQKQLKSIYSFHNDPFQRMHYFLTGLNKVDIQIATERRQIPYLPQGHNIMKIEKLQYEKKYQISKYMNKQLPFCITILSRNNIQNGRYWKVINTILQQQYKNYHIVFIDDFSADETLNQTVKYLESRNFPAHRVTYVQNIKHMFATYNIINAAYRHCKSQDIQMLVDGDDQIIGSQVLSLYNAVYQSVQPNDNDVWHVYSSYKDNFYQFGYSGKIKSNILNIFTQKRVSGLAIGAIRTWKVKLIYQIPLQYHLMADGKWLDTMYDDALSYSMLELCTSQRMIYLPHVLYEYNRGYGNNDDSSLQKLNHRKNVFLYTLNKPKLPALTQALFLSSQRNQQILTILTKDEGINYKVLTF